jgi:hypothetical protein
MLFTREQTKKREREGAVSFNRLLGSILVVSSPPIWVK